MSSQKKTEGAAPNKMPKGGPSPRKIQGGEIPKKRNRESKYPGGRHLRKILVVGSAAASPMAHVHQNLINHG